ncbi:MAG: hypothetical protein AAFU78_20025 [Cyanobacteria bacterium J06633_2]
MNQTQLSHPGSAELDTLPLLEVEKFVTVTNFFDYETLDMETRLAVKRYDEKYEENVQSAGLAYISACKALLEIQKALRFKKPGFVEYIKSKSGLATKTAYRMLTIAKKADQFEEINAAQHAFYLMATVPEDVNEQVVLEEAKALSDNRQVQPRDIKHIIEQEKERASNRKVKEKPEPVYHEGDRLWTVFGTPQQVMVVRHIQYAGGTNQYECCAVETGKPLVLGEQELCRDYPIQKIEEDIEPKFEPISEYEQNLFSVVTASERLTQAEETVQVLNTALEVVETLLSELFHRCRQLPTDEREAVFADGLGDRIERALFPGEEP